MIMVFVTFLLTISALPVFTLIWKLKIIENGRYVSMPVVYYFIQLFYFTDFIFSMIFFSTKISTIDLVNIILSTIYITIFIILYFKAYYKNKHTIDEIVDYLKLKHSLKKHQIKLYKNVLSDIKRKLFQDGHYTITIPKTCFSDIKTTKGLSYYSAVYRLAITKVLSKGEYIVSYKGNWHQRDKDLIIMIDKKGV